MNKQQYLEYLQSPLWKRKCLKVLEYWNHTCVICMTNNRLEVHHRTYIRVGHERFTDLVPLCHSCHTTFYPMMQRPEWEAIGPELQRYRRAIGEM